MGERGWAQWREEQSQEGMPRRVGWRKGGVWWGDGLVAGGLLGVGVGALCTSAPVDHHQTASNVKLTDENADRLPRPLFVRSAVIGMIMGATTSGLQTVQAKIGQMREQQEQAATTPMADAAAVEISRPLSKESTMPITSPEVSADSELPQIPQPTTPGSGWSRLWSWIPGTSR